MGREPGPQGGPGCTNGKAIEYQVSLPSEYKGSGRWSQGVHPCVLRLDRFWVPTRSLCTSDIEREGVAGPCASPRAGMERPTSGNPGAPLDKEMERKAGPRTCPCSRSGKSWPSWLPVRHGNCDGWGGKCIDQRIARAACAASDTGRVGDAGPSESLSADREKQCLAAPAARRDPESKVAAASCAFLVMGMELEAGRSRWVPGCVNGETVAGRVPVRLWNSGIHVESGPRPSPDTGTRCQSQGRS